MSVQEQPALSIRHVTPEQARTVTIVLQAPLGLLGHYRELVGRQLDGVLVESVGSGEGGGPRALVHLRALDGAPRTWLEYRAALEELERSPT